MSQYVHCETYNTSYCKKKKKILRLIWNMYSILVLSHGIAVGCFPGGSVPNDPREPGCNDSSRMAVRNQQAWVVYQDKTWIIICGQYFHIHIRACADVPKTWVSSGQPLPRIPFWERDHRISELLEVKYMSCSGFIAKGQFDWGGKL